MNFQIDSEINSGYPHIPDMPEIPDISLSKPYYKYIHILDNNRNNGYPTFEIFEDMPVTAMQKIYPHGLMMCMGADVNNGYPCIPEISSVRIKKFSTLYFGEKHITDMYYRQKPVSVAYCNEKEVFSVRYTVI